MSSTAGPQKKEGKMRIRAFPVSRAKSFSATILCGEGYNIIGESFSEITIPVNVQHVSMLCISDILCSMLVVYCYLFASVTRSGSLRFSRTIHTGSLRFSHMIHSRSLRFSHVVPSGSLRFSRKS